LLGTAGWQMALTHWQRSLDTTWRANVIWLETMDALVREHMTHFQAASEQALATGRALTAAAEPEARARLASDYLRASLDRTLASTATVMELLARIAREQKRSVLAVTHDPRTLGYADRVVRIEDGLIVGEERRPDGLDAPRVTDLTKRRKAHG